MLVGEIEERLKPNLKRMQIGRRPRGMQTPSNLAKDSTRLVIPAGSRHLGEVTPDCRPLQEQSIVGGCEDIRGTDPIPPLHQLVPAPLIRCRATFRIAEVVAFSRTGSNQLERVVMSTPSGSTSHVRRSASTSGGKLVTGRHDHGAGRIVKLARLYAGG
jgi:hypothetical protein